MLQLPVILFSILLILAFSFVAWQGFTKHRILLAFLISSGMSMLFGGMSHIFVPDIVAKNIGWKTCPEFQYEIGISNIIIGILLIMTFYFSNDWILAAVISSTIWGWGNAIGHIISYTKTNNKSPGNTGWVLYFNIFIPLISIILYSIQ